VGGSVRCDVLRKHFVTDSDLTKTRLTPVFTQATEFRTLVQTPKLVEYRVSFGLLSLAHPHLPKGLCVISCPRTKSLLGWGKSELHGWNHTKALLKFKSCVDEQAESRQALQNDQSSL